MRLFFIVRGSWECGLYCIMLPLFLHNSLSQYILIFMLKGLINCKNCYINSIICFKSLRWDCQPFFTASLSERQQCFKVCTLFPLLIFSKFSIFLSTKTFRMWNFGKFGILFCNNFEMLQCKEIYYFLHLQIFLILL